MKVYLDNGASTKTDEKVLSKMLPYFSEKYANASATYSIGQDARDKIDEARLIIAKSLGARQDEIIFTSGGTESNNFAIKGIAWANKNKGNHIITTKIEHDCVRNTCKWLETQGFEVTYLNVDNAGFVSLADLEKAITEKTILVSIIHGNNEIGTIQDIQKLGEICRKKGVYFHTDACQSYTKTKVNVEEQNLDLVTVNSHKIHGPKGVGALYVKKGIKITPLIHGGGHEFNFRSGTENVPGIIGFSEAVSIGLDEKHKKYMTKLRDLLITKILETIPKTKLNGPIEEKRLCNNVNMIFSGVEGEALGAYLNQKGICTSTGSACSSRNLDPSHVLKAIGLSDADANSSIRLTLSKFTTEEEINYTIEALSEVIEKLRRISPFGNGCMGAACCGN